MNQEKIGKIIKEIRVKKAMSQKEFAEKFGVTYQAVSKWENGKNIPDITILKEICNEYNLSLEEFLNNKVVKKNKISKNVLIIPIIIFILTILFVIFYVILNDNDFEFKKLTSSCSDFSVTGSMAYNKEKSSIYISDIIYCGEDKLEKYENISCTLYQIDGKSKVIIDECEKKTNVTLEEFLQNTTFSVNNYDNTCETYSKNSLYLEIEATKKNGKINFFKVPLELLDNCMK